MEDKQKVDLKEEMCIKQSLNVNKGPTLFGSVDLPKPKEYLCPSCGTILAADILWKDMGDGMQKPFCGYCRSPVVLISKAN
jgi:hypothetical protein